MAEVVLDQDHLDEVVDWLMDLDAWSFDCETKGEWRLDPRRNEVFWLQFGAAGRTVVIPFGHPIGHQIGFKKVPRLCADGKTRNFKTPCYSKPPRQLRPGDVFAALEPAFFESKATKYGHNIKFDLESVAKYYEGDVPVGPYHDTQIAAFLINENLRTYDLGVCVRRSFDFTYDKSMSKAVDTYPFEMAARYCHYDAHFTWLLGQEQIPLLEKEGQTGEWNLAMDLMMPLVDMELTGAPADYDALVALDKKLDKRLVEATADLYRIAGRKWNFGSSPQRVELFYGRKRDGGRGLKCQKFTPKGGLSCDEEALRYHEGDELVDAYLAYQEISKISSTYVKAYLGSAEAKVRNKARNNAPPYNPETGRIHANFKQHGAVTGRFSCVAADSLIEMPRDLVANPVGVPITAVKEGDWVYAFDWQRELVLRRVKWVGQTGVKQTVVVTAENSEGHQKTLRLTPEHLVRMWNGDWRPAGSLLHAVGRPHRADGPRLMTMVKRTIDDGYVKFFPHAVARSGGTKGGGRSREHRWIVEQVTGKRLSTKADVHHVDGSRANNSVSNLEALTVSEHRGRRHLHPGWGKRALRRVSPALYDGPTDYRVVSVSPGPMEPVWDMEVEDAHNFIANGICVHNCTEPNLQNIPRPDTELGQQIRGLFIAPEGETLIVSDWSQIEYRFLAWYSGDPKLMKTFEDGIDFHLAVAGMLLQKDIKDVTKVERTTAKNCNFAAVYGAGPAQVASMSGISVEEAKTFLALHKRMLPTVYRFNDQVIRVAKSRRPIPYVRTILGRRRRLPQLMWRDNWAARGYAERQAVNTVIQGSAADLMKLAIVRLYAEMDDDMSLLLTVHDELVMSVPDARVERGLEVMREAMEGPEIAKLIAPVPLIADIHAVKRWSDAKE